MEILNKKILSIIAGCLVTVVGGVFTFTKYMNEQQVKVLEERIRLEESKVKELEAESLTLTKEVAEERNKLKLITQNAEPEATPVLHSTILPVEIQVNAYENPETKTLIEKVEKLEKERANLLKRLSDAAVHSLDPSSEVSILLEQLEQGVLVNESVSTLFKIKAPISFKPLADYFSSNVKDGYLSGEYAYSWLKFFIAIDKEAGLSFTVSQLENEQISQDTVYSVLSRDIDSKKACDLVSQDLERIALTNSDSNVRGVAKLLLDCKNLEDSASVASTYNSDDIQSYHVVYKLFSDASIEHDFHEMVLRSGRVYYWATASYLYAKSLKSDKADIYLELLIRLAENEMSLSSQAFILTLINKRQMALGNKAEAEKALELCYQQSPISCKFLVPEH